MKRLIIGLLGLICTPAFAGGWTTATAEPSASTIQQAHQAQVNNVISALTSKQPVKVRAPNSVRSFTLTPANGVIGTKAVLLVHGKYNATSVEMKSVPGFVEGKYHPYWLKVIKAWVDWGDGSTVQQIPPGVKVSHVYGAASYNACYQPGKLEHTCYGKITLTGKQYNGQPIQFTEQFSYVVWKTKRQARYGDVTGRRVFSLLGTDAVDCSTYYTNGKCDGSTALSIPIKYDSWNILCWNNCHGWYEHWHRGYQISKDFKLKAMKIDLRRNRVTMSAHFAYHSWPAQGLWWPWLPLEPQIGTGDEGCTEHRTLYKTENGILIDYCNYALEDGGLYAFMFEFSFPPIDPDVLSAICDGGPNSTMNLVSSTKGVIGSGGCKTNWIISTDGTQGWMGSDLSLRLHFVAGTQGNQPNNPAGGHMTINTPLLMYRKMVH